ncbi:AraC family transcriptional regulator [Acaryochloris marina]|uniref:helix-turn-helix transcriptional regulator n=1 Tax=Acaryochloris marina TaxID=155978 RepID=UPI001BAFA8A5|nr:AraC family transcriptional regulator [Acaryochloris marina]QUY43764.1 helix-turn-helix transcriptional regulator [Acaryochloris marina S15]
MKSQHSTLAQAKLIEGLQPKLATVSLMPTTNQAEIIQLPSPACSGSIQKWRLRPGLELVIHEIGIREKIVIERDTSNKETQLGLSFCLAGQIRGMGLNAEQALQFEAGQVSLGVINGGKRRVEYAEKQRISLVHCHVQPETIGLSNQDSIDQLPQPLQEAISGRDRPSYFQSASMTPLMTATVRQLLQCPYQGLSQRLYIESKTLELIGLYFDQLLSNDRSQHQGAGLSGDEVDRIHYARDIILSQIDNPPTLLELAHRVGLNDRKLKQGFRQVFGTTVFSYLHKHRMEQAQQLLLMPGATIAGVAQAVGYRSPEAFSVSFRRTFAISPKAYQMGSG